MRTEQLKTSHTVSGSGYCGEVEINHIVWWMQFEREEQHGGRIVTNINTHNLPQAVCLSRGQETPPLMRNCITASFMRKHFITLTQHIPGGFK